MNAKFTDLTEVSIFLSKKVKIQMFLFAALAHSAYYSSYHTIKTIDDVADCTSMQGFAVGSKYLYSIKVNSKNSKAVIFKTHKETKKVTQLKNGDDQTMFAKNLGHANDADVLVIDGKSHLFIATMKKTDEAIVVLKIDGSKFTKVGHFSLKYNGKAISVSGIAIKGKTETQIKLLFKSGRTFYKGRIELDQRYGTIELTKAFTINTAEVKINGRYNDLSSFTHQGFGYHNKTIYVPLTDLKQVSVVAVYNIAKAKDEIDSVNNLSFRITSSKYSLFEIESCGISGDNLLYFNTNRRTLDGKGSDMIAYFKGYTYN